MPTLMIDLIASLDAYGAADDWPGLWGMAGPEYMEWIGDDSETGHVSLMGANTYREMSGFAEDLADEPSMRALTAAPKVVFSSSLSTPLSWDNTELVGGDAVEAVREMKDRGERPLRTLGSLSLGRSLVEGGVVDRIRVVVFPVITGASGTGRLWEGYPDLKLDLVDQRLFDGRLQLLEYVPTVLEEPPGSDAPMVQ